MRQLSGLPGMTKCKKCCVVWSEFIRSGNTVDAYIECASGPFCKRHCVSLLRMLRAVKYHIDRRGCTSAMLSVNNKDGPIRYMLDEISAAFRSVFPYVTSLRLDVDSGSLQTMMTGIEERRVARLRVDTKEQLLKMTNAGLSAAFYTVHEYYCLNEFASISAEFVPYNDRHISNIVVHLRDACNSTLYYDTIATNNECMGSSAWWENEVFRVVDGKILSLVAPGQQ